MYQGTIERRVRSWFFEANTPAARVLRVALVMAWPAVGVATGVPICLSAALFGAPCPGCGLTRSFVALASGDVAESFRFHRLGWLMFLATASQIPYRIVRLRQLRRGDLAERRWPTWFGSMLIAALILNWIAGVIGRAW